MGDLRRSIFKMPKEVSGSGTNKSGHGYTNYSDGGYRYTNYNSSGGKSSTYYNTGSGHSFYKGTNGVSFHENSNQGFRDYSYSNTSGSGSGGKGQAAHPDHLKSRRKIYVLDFQVQDW